MHQFGQANSRAEVREQSEILSKRQQSGAFGLFRGWKGFPFGSADRPKQNGIALFTGFESLLRKSFAMRIDRLAPNGLFAEFEPEGELLFDRVEHAQGLSHDLRADAVACQDGDLVGIAHLPCMEAADRSAGKPPHIPLRCVASVASSGGLSGGARSPDKFRDAIPGFPSRTVLHPAGRVDSVRVNDPDGFADVFGCKTPGQDHLPGGLGINEFAQGFPIKTEARAAVGGL